MSEQQHRFNLIIPTFERPAALKALLVFLAARQFRYPIVILDSSSEAVRAENIANVKGLGLKIGYGAYDPATKPFDKFRDGLSRIQAPYCALCADDDLILPDALDAALDFLDAHPDYGMAHGNYFTFLPNGDGKGSLDILDVLYDSPSIDLADPLGRISTLFQRYQATTYGFYRTKLLHGIFHVTQPVESLLARELLASALTAAAGKIARLPIFSHGRSMAPSHHYAHWHPLEWLMRDAPGLFGEYAKYRAILLANLPDHFTNRPVEETARLIDTIHAFYLVRHVPVESQGFILEKLLNRTPIDQFWPDHAIQIPLIKMAQVEEHADPAPSLAPSPAPVPLTPLVDAPPVAETAPPPRPGFFARLFGGGRAADPVIAAPAPPPVTAPPVTLAPVTPAPPSPAEWPRSVRGAARWYRFHEGFAKGAAKIGQSVPVDAQAPLVATLESYDI